MILHCTQKLLKGLGNPQLQNHDEPTTGLGNWYANLLTIDKRKCILFTNEKTLYSFLVPKVKKENLKNIADEFLLNLSLNLQAEGFPIEIISRVMQEYTDIGFAKTASKRILGSMNELTFQYKYIIINHFGGIENIRMLGVNKEINRTIMGGIKYLRPIESLQELLLGVRQP
jgi:Domain of unknown function (DUF6933)